MAELCKKLGPAKLTHPQTKALVNKNHEGFTLAELFLLFGLFLGFFLICLIYSSAQLCMPRIYLIINYTAEARKTKQNHPTALGKWKASLANIQASTEPERTEHEE